MSGQVLMSYSMTETPTTTNINVEGQPAPFGSVEFDVNDFGEQDAPCADVELLQHFLLFLFCLQAGPRLQWEFWREGPPLAS